MVEVASKVFSNVHILLVAVQSLVSMVNGLLLHLLKHIGLLNVGFGVRHPKV